MEDERFVRIYVHPLLKEEFDIRQNALREEMKKIGKELRDSIPIISLMCAKILQKERLRDKKYIRAEIVKIKGVKKNEITFL